MKIAIKILLVASLLSLTGCDTIKAYLGLNIVEQVEWQYLEADQVDAALVTTTDKGQVAGYRHEQGFLRFSSIPFAAPPIGELRYRAPQPLEPWSGILDSREFAPSCIQAVSFFESTSILEQSEDCLWLTVSTPATDDKKRPVIVWIHGGGYTQGGARDPGYDGAGFVTSGDVVFVNVQYRLRSLGWMNFSQLEDGDKGSVLNATKDQMAALQWVQHNIANFGGDPANVTIMGESAGSGSVAALLHTPAAKPLYHKAILQSGIWEIMTDAMPPQQATEIFMQLAGVASVAELQALDIKTLNGVQDAFVDKMNELGLLGDGPAYGPESFSRAELRAMAADGKPILHGTTRHELHFMAMVGGLEPEEYRGAIENTMMTMGFSVEQTGALVAKLKQATPERSEHDLYIDLLTHLFFTYPHKLFSQEASQVAPVYQYVFDVPLPVNPELGAIHFLDVPYVFGTLDAIDWAKGDDVISERISRQMQDAWIAFARTGNPNHVDIPEWPAYKPQAQAVLRFAENTELLEDHHAWMEAFGMEADTMLKIDRGPRLIEVNKPPLKYK